MVQSQIAREVKAAWHFTLQRLADHSQRLELHSAALSTPEPTGIL
jgi:hypothetical protein